MGTQIIDDIYDDHISVTIRNESGERKLRTSSCGADGAHSWVRRHARLGRPPEAMIGFR